MTLNDKQTKTLEFIRTYLLENGYPPTIREIEQAVPFSSTSVVDYNLKALQREGLIYRDKTVSRGIRLTEEYPRRLPPAGLIKVPLVGRIAAGQPIPVPDNAYPADEMIEIPTHLVRGDDLFALKVKGTSMIDALINDGDIVIMKQTNTALNGDMVAVWLTDREETTLKRFFHEGEKVRLQPENSTMAAIYVDPAVVEIQGKIVAVVRSVN